MKKIWLILVVLAFVGLAVLVAPPARVSAQQPTPSDDEVNAIARQLFCPVCQNTPLDVCPTQACHQWRELIRQMLGEGKTPAEIKQYFVDYYGASVLSTPPARGINWLIYVVPPLAFLLSVFLLFQAFRMWRKPTMKPGTTPLSGTAQDLDPNPVEKNGDPYLSRLENELKKRG